MIETIGKLTRELKRAMPLEVIEPDVRRLIVYYP
jgi:hypothetical protein